MDDVLDLAVKFKTIGGDFITKALTSDQINMLLRGNPNDIDGFWPVQEVYKMI